MKKIFTAALAASMVASMAVSSFAVTTKVSTLGEGAQKYDADADPKFSAIGPKVAYGETIFYAFESADGKAISEYDAVKGTSLKQKWELNGSAIEKLEVVKKKFGAASTDYAYYLSVKTKDNASVKDMDVVGTVSLKKTGTDGFEFNHPVNVTLGYTAVTDSTTIGTSVELHSFAESTDQTINFAAADSNYFVVNTVGQGKLLAKADTKYNADIAAKYPAANLDFFNGNGVSFNKIGELSIAAAPGSFLYVAGTDGTLSAVKATYDEYEEVFKVSTRTLGQYVISDVELKIAPTAPGTKPNPGTGANA